MNINTDLLFELLSEKYRIQRKGRSLKGTSLRLPQFYERGMELEKGGIYIARSHELPATCRCVCLFICVGSIPTGIWSDWSSEIFYIMDSHADILSVLNAIQNALQTVTGWELELEQILRDGGNIKKMVEISIPIFNNKVCVTDYELQILGHCSSDGVIGEKRQILRDDLLRIPENYSAGFAKDFSQAKLHKEPYYFKSSEGNTVYNNYCINLFLSDEYIGACALTEDGRSFTNRDILLFQRFANYIRKAIIAQSQDINTMFVSIKTIFSELLMNLPVSNASMEQALKLMNQGECKKIKNPVWYCVVVRSANRTKTLPSGYLCTTLEALIPYSVAFVHESAIVAFAMAECNSNFLEETSDNLKPFIHDMNFQAGISYPFTDIFKARSYYLQALKVLENGFERESGIRSFSSYSLEYMLNHCCGSFTPDLLMPPGLLALRNAGSSVDYWDTLRRYLDNECNASKTAEEMYLHRSSLLPRLEKIKTYVNLDTAEQRLELRMCMRAYEIAYPMK